MFERMIQAGKLEESVYQQAVIDPTLSAEATRIVLASSAIFGLTGMAGSIVSGQPLLFAVTTGLFTALY